MKPTELDSLMNSASSSNSSNNSNLRGSKARGGFPPITREARSRTRRWLLLLILCLILLFLGWRFFVRPWLFPMESRSLEDRGQTRLYPTTLPYDDYDQSTSVKQSTSSPTSSTPLLTDKPTLNDDRPEIMLRPPAITWTGKQEETKPDEEDPLSSLESRFKIQAQLDQQDWKVNDRTNPQLEAVVTGRYSNTDLHKFGHATARPQTTQQPNYDLNHVQTTTKSRLDEDYEDENRILFERRPQEGNEKEKTTRPKSNPAAKAHPSAPKHSSMSSTTTSAPSTSVASGSPRKSDGSHIVHPHANSGAFSGRDSAQTTSKVIAQTTSSPLHKDPVVDADLKDLISQLEKDAPVWRIAPQGFPEVTPPPKPIDTTDVNPKFKLPAFNIHASVQTIPVNKNYDFKPHVDQTDRRHKIDKRSDTPVIVTGLLNIGRGDWMRFTRPYDLYLDYLLDLLKLDNRFIIYCDEEAEQFLAKQQGLDWDRLQLMRITLQDLPFYRYRDEIAKIIDYEQKNWNSSWDKRFRDHPEAMFPDYNILVNSKPYLMHNATQISRFETEFYVWVDAGYSHGSKEIIPHGLWDPELSSGKITVIKVTPEVDKPERYTLEMIYRKRWDVISGGFLAGDAPTIRRFSVFFFKTFMNLLDQGKIDDDQTVLLMTIKNYASTFKILVGGWFDAFKLVANRQYDG